MLWLIGSGYMAKEYGKVLKKIGNEFAVIGRGVGSAEKFQADTGKEVVVGGLEKFLATKPALPSHVIVAVSVETLFEATTQLLKYGVKHILLEKPGAIGPEQFATLSDLARQSDARIDIAYNRRFYASTLWARKLIADDGGVTSFNFEFTEWSHTIAPLPKSKEAFEAWLLANSSHVIDLSFFLGGFPTEMSSFSSGAEVLAWHPVASIFAGSGRTSSGALFSYQANWAAPGRWVAEILTKKHRFIFKPLEELKIQKIGSVAIDNVEIPADLALVDKECKPGLFAQTEAFLRGDRSLFVDIHEQKQHLKIYDTILRGGQFEARNHNG